MWTGITITILIILFILWKMFLVVEMRHAVVRERLGKFRDILKPGFHFMVPFLDRAAYTVEMREEVLDVPSQSCITQDNIQVQVDGVLYLKVMDAYKASYGIEDYRRACVNLAQTTMRAEIGKISLDHTFSGREAINDSIVRELDKASDPWGVKVLRYEIKDITPTTNVIDTMERQMEAERDKRAQIIASTGQKQFKINLSSGDRQSAINLSEGEKQKRINEAHGRAKEIELLAGATAQGIREIAEAIGQPGGSDAVKLRIVEQFIYQLQRILADSDISVVPAGLANIQGMFEGLGEVGHKMSGK